MVLPVQPSRPGNVDLFGGGTPPGRHPRWCLPARFQDPVTRAAPEGTIRRNAHLAALVHKSGDGRGAAAVAVVQVVRCDTGMPSRVIRLSTEQATLASVFWPGRVRARRRRPMMAL